MKGIQQYFRLFHQAAAFSCPAAMGNRFKIFTSSVLKTTATALSHSGSYKKRRLSRPCCTSRSAEIVSTCAVKNWQVLGGSWAKCHSLDTLFSRRCRPKTPVPPHPSPHIQQGKAIVWSSLKGSGHAYMRKTHSSSQAPQQHHGKSRSFRIDVSTAVFVLNLLPSLALMIGIRADLLKENWLLVRAKAKFFWQRLRHSPNVPSSIQPSCQLKR